MSDFEARPFELTAKDTEGKVKEVTERLEAGVRELFESERYQALSLIHILYIMGEETLSKYALYMSVLGNRPDLFGNSEYISRYITNRPAGYEIPASALEDETFATLIAEAEKRCV